jgi:hypothetical protein
MPCAPLVNGATSARSTTPPRAKSLASRQASSRRAPWQTSATPRADFRRLSAKQKIAAQVAAHVAAQVAAQVAAHVAAPTNQPTFFKSKNCNVCFCSSFFWFNQVTLSVHLLCSIKSLTLLDQVTSSVHLLHFPTSPTHNCDPSTNPSCTHGDVGMSRCFSDI